jgi:hypothetical protein
MPEQPSPSEGRIASELRGWGFMIGVDQPYKPIGFSFKKRAGRFFGQ